MAKKESLLNNIQHFQPGVFFLQETKVSRKGQIKVENYEIFEVVRPNCPTGGSILTGVHKNLHPVFISGGEENIEILVVQAKIGKYECRFINGYGPQEYQNFEDRVNFYARLEQEVINAKMFENLICIEMDANAKLGPELIQSDPNPRSGNGDFLIAMCERNNLVICNTSDLCQGVITRQRVTVNGTEESAIDYFILCQEMFAYLSSMIIDEDRTFVLSKYSKSKGKVIVTESDHNPLICTFNYLWSDQSETEKQRYEIFKFNDPEGIIKFNELTSSNTLSNCIKESDVKLSSKKWLKAFNNIMQRSFKKVRISNNQQFRNDEVQTLMKAKVKISLKINEILAQLEQNPKDIEEQSTMLVSLYGSIDSLDTMIADICALKNVNTIKDHYETVVDASGTFNIPKMWGLKKKLNLNSSDVPTAKKDKDGNLITTKNGLLALYKTTYIERLSHKSI